MPFISTNRRTGRATLAALALAAIAPLHPAIAQDRAMEPAPAQSQPATALEMRAEQVVALVNGDPGVPLSDMFTAGFLAAVPEAQLRAISAQLTSQFGAALRVEQLGSQSDTRASLALRMERAIARGGIAIDPADGNRISELVFRTFDPIDKAVPADDSVDRIEADLSALPGTTSVYFAPVAGGEPVIARNEAALMPLGSTFKLYVLATLARDVAQGRRAWDDVVPLEQRSYPSGILQDWPQGSPVTLHTLATLMISISDNTATDALIAVLGRDNVYATMSDSGHDDPRANDPFLTTRELFMLKGGPQPLRTAYQSGDRDERARILAGLSSVTVDDESDRTRFRRCDPVAPEIEWFASARDIADLFVFMRATADPASVRNHVHQPGPSRRHRRSLGVRGVQGWLRAGRAAPRLVAHRRGRARPCPRAGLERSGRTARRKPARRHRAAHSRAARLTPRPLARGEGDP